jgi:formylglycine-generating enzyme required for sulfatase activity
MARRRRIPQDIRDKLLVDAMHRCCLCPQHEDVTDLHHIIPISEDGPNTEENLIVVCPNCHRKIHSIRTRYPPRQLRMYKERWVGLCALGLTLEERLMLALAIDHESPLDAALRAARLETFSRDTDGNVRIGDIILNPTQVSALSHLLADLPDDTSDETRHQLAAATGMTSEDVVPPADFAARAQEYARRQQAQRGDLARAEEEESVYISLQLRFSRSTRAPQDDLFRKLEEPTFDDIQAAVDAPAPRSDPPAPAPAMVLLGEPGSGKSTSLRHLALAKYRDVLSDPPSAHLPLFVNLGDHASGSPADFLAEQWRQGYKSGDLPAIMQAGRLWLLVDGLNEMPSADERDYEARVRVWRRFFKNEFPPGNRALVACRVADYGTGLDLPRLHVEPMDDGRIADFVAARFQKTPDRGGHLLAELQADRRARGVEHGLYGLARNPFWLVMLADVYLECDQLPRNRAALVQDFVDRWLVYEADRQPERLLTGPERAALQLALDKLAFASLNRGQNAPQPQEWVLKQLPEQVELSGLRVAMLPEIALRLAESASLLECRGRAEARNVRFYHQLLLEYFAGRELLRRFQNQEAHPRQGREIPISAGQTDIYVLYETGLLQLLDRLGREHPQYAEVLVYQQRLSENLTQSRQYGNTDSRKAERAEIIGHLNKIALATLGLSFDELCHLSASPEEEELPQRLHVLWRIPWAEKWEFVESEWDPLAPPPTTGWEEATALAAARAALAALEMGGDGDWSQLTLAVLPHNPPLAARCLLEAGVSPLPEGARDNITDHLLAVLEDPAVTAGLDPRQRISLRIACGQALGHLGDPRILSGERHTPDDVRYIPPQWSHVIRAGSFLMGSRRDDPDAYQDEYSPATNFEPHSVDILYDYVVGLYPVTNAEYACFIQDGGYQEEDCWETENARAWLRGALDLSGPWLKRWRQIAGWVREGQVDPDEWLAQRRISPDEAETWKWAGAASDEELEAAVRQASGAAGSGQRPTQPRFWDDARYNNPSQPVVGVCWFEAMAYCAWLTEQFRVSSSEFGVLSFGLPADALSRLGTQNSKLETLRVRLPSEAEWEKAARWDGAAARRYPWGDGWDEGRANALEGRVLTTSPVGIYPEGASPYGALDVAGNVWEWTRSRWGAEVERPDFGYPYRLDDGREDEGATDLRVVRGGSWDSEARHARAAFRYRDLPGDRSGNLGFRLVLQLS